MRFFAAAVSAVVAGLTVLSQTLAGELLRKAFSNRRTCSTDIRGCLAPLYARQQGGIECNLARIGVVVGLDIATSAVQALALSSSIQYAPVIIHLRSLALSHQKQRQHIRRLRRLGGPNCDSERPDGRSGYPSRGPGKPDRASRPTESNGNGP
jgi:hypothetical protein